MGIKYCLKNICYTVENKKPVIHIFARDKDLNFYHFEIKDFKPYFYIPAKSKTLKKSIYNEYVRRVTVDLPENVPEERKKYEKTYEADIPFVMRFLIDKGIKYGFLADYSPTDFFVESRKVYWDIETANSLNNYKKPIICISILDSYSKKMVQFVWREDLKDRKEVKKVGKYVEYEVVRLYFNSETKMLYAFFKIINKLKPDLLIGFNSISFDWTYLKERAKILKLEDKLKLLSPIGVISGDQIYGLEQFDLQQGYLKIVSKQLPDKSLGYLAKTYLGEKQDDEFDYEKAWKEDLDKLLERNLNHTRWCYELDKTLRITEFFENIQKTVGIYPLSNTLVNSWVVDTFLLRIAKELDVVLPTKPDKEERKKRLKEKEIKGAIILQPPKGLFRNVAVFDFSAMYPSVILNYKISPDRGYQPEDKLIYPLAIKRLSELRAYYKKLRDNEKDGVRRETFDKMQEAVKYVINSIFGQSGYEGSRLFKVEVANEITARARELITKTKEFVEKLGYKVLYADTDSLFITPVEEWECETLLERINSQYNGFKMDLKFWGSAYFFGVKKMYVLRNDYGDEIIKGLKIVRSDSSLFLQRTLKKIVELIFQNKKEELLNYIRTLWNEYRKLPADEIATPKSIDVQNLDKYSEEYKRNAFWRGVYYAKKYLGEVFTYKAPKRIYVKSVPDGYPQTDVVCFNNPRVVDGFQIDYVKMWNSDVYNTLLRILSGFFDEREFKVVEKLLQPSQETSLLKF